MTQYKPPSSESSNVRCDKRKRRIASMRKRQTSSLINQLQLEPRRTKHDSSIGEQIRNGLSGKEIFVVVIHHCIFSFIVVKKAFDAAI